MSVNQNPEPQNQPPHGAPHQQNPPQASYWNPPPPQPQMVPQQQFAPAFRPQAPSVAMTVVITLFFGVFGLIAAASASSKASQLGYPTGKYWGTWFLIMAIWFVLVVAMVA